MMSDMKVFSNCPSFVFMNAKLFEERGFLLSWAKELYDPRVFADTEEAKVDTTAPATSKDVRCEKSLYYAALYIKSLSPITILSYLSRVWVIKDTKTLLWNIKDSNKVNFKVSALFSLLLVFLNFNFFPANLYRFHLISNTDALVL